MVTHFGKLIDALASAGVEFIVVGGVALVSRGGSRLTQDLDVVYERSAGNLDRLVAALGPLHPRLRGAPADLPFFFDARTKRACGRAKDLLDLELIEALRKAHGP